MICVNTLKVSPSSLTLKEGDWYYDATVEICPTNATCADVRWTSSNTNVATVNETTGYIHAVGKGTATIRATAQDGSGKSDTISVTVIEDVKVTSIELCVDKFAVKVGNTYSLCANIEPINATYRELVWSSSNTSVATVDHNVVRGVSAGTAVITAHATDGSGKCACCTVVVTNYVPVNEVTIEEKDSFLPCGTMFLNEYRTLHETVYPEYASNKTVLWHSSNPNVISVDEETGRIHALSIGSAELYAVSQSENWIYDSYNISVGYDNLNSYQIQAINPSLKVGESTSFTVATSSPLYEACEVTWHSSDDDIASIDQATGIVTGKNPGQVIITRRINHNNATASCTITVHNKERVRITENGQGYTVSFENSKIWKSIDPDEMTSEMMDEHSQHNATQGFSTSDLAYLYLLNPEGVVYFVKSIYYENTFDSVGKYYLAKDDIYYNIVNDRPRYFLPYTSRIKYYKVDGIPTPESRKRINSDAELLFGMHKVLEWGLLLDYGEQLLINTLEALFTSIPLIANINLAIDIFQAAYFSVSVYETPCLMFENASSHIKERLDAEADRLKGTKLETASKKSLIGFKALKHMFNHIIVNTEWLINWATLPILADIEVGNKVSSKAYDTYLLIDDTEVNIETISKSSCLN